MKNIVVTGTSRGIGFQLAQILASQGHRVIAVSRNSEPLKNLNIKNIECVSCDICEEDDLDAVADIVEKEWGRVDVLIHNAGALLHKAFSKTTLADFEEIYKVNVFAVAEMTRRLMPYLHPDAHVLAVSSMGGVQGSAKFAGLSAYSSSKGAVITLMELLAEEYKETGLSFNILALGAVQTEMLAEAFPGYEAPVSAEEMAAYIADFALTGHKLYNGKLLQVSKSTP